MLPTLTDDDDTTADNNDDVFSLLPFGSISDFCPLSDILNLRLTCLQVCEAVGEGVSLEYCCTHLSRVLEEQNSHLTLSLLTTTTNNNNNDDDDCDDWKQSATTTTRAAAAAATTTTHHNDQTIIRNLFSSSNDYCYLDKLLRVLRVFKHLPRSLVVAFNGKYGRHCMPIEWDSTERRVKVKSFPPCPRGRHRCESCHMKPNIIPALQQQSSTIRNNSTMNIDEYLELNASKNKGKIDLRNSSYIPKCIPNLPGDLICPNCQRNDQRTLMLFEFSYKSESVVGRPDQTLLTWTPASTTTSTDDTDAASEGDTDDDDGGGSDDDDDSSIRHDNKRQKTDDPSTEKEESPSPPPRCCYYSYSPPVMYDDMAIPVRDRPLQLKQDCKFAISIACTNCGWSVFSPASVCWSRDYVCGVRNVQVHNEDSYTSSGGGSNTLLGGVLVRQKCSQPDCYCSVTCPSCANTTNHDSYSQGNNYYHPPSHCNSCNVTFCNQHSWLSTICHHS